VSAHPSKKVLSPPVCPASTTSFALSAIFVAIAAWVSGRVASSALNCSSACLIPSGASGGCGVEAVDVIDDAAKRGLRADSADLARNVERIPRSGLVAHNQVSLDVKGRPERAVQLINETIDDRLFVEEVKRSRNSPRSLTAATKGLRRRITSA
jgi:hypothetical protein